MKLQYRIDLLSRLGEYISGNDDGWMAAKQKASQENAWFTPAFVDHAVQVIAQNFLDTGKLREWTRSYALPEENPQPKTVGLVMAGNIPLVGFHDFLAVMISGHRALIKPSSRDQALIRHLAEKLIAWSPALGDELQFSEQLKGCDAYITTGSNNSSRYFEYYFSKYPHIIRRNRTSVAILSGHEGAAELAALADDVHLYFGLGCRNITKIFVPAGYGFEPMLEGFEKYAFLADHHKYKNNYDYNLALLILNKKYYMTNGSILLVEEPGVFSPISQLHYEFYTDRAAVEKSLLNNPDIQCIAGMNPAPFGQTQSPGLADYADGVDSLQFLATL